MTLPDGTTQALGPAVRDAFAIFEDLSLLGNGKCPQFLQLEYLHKMFSLELIESVLANYHELFRKHSELVLLLQHYLFPLLLKTLFERSAFPLALRGTRVVFLRLLLKQFSSELEAEAEVILTLLIKLISGETDTCKPQPGWMRVLAMEIMRGSQSSSSESDSTHSSRRTKQSQSQPQPQPRQRTTSKTSRRSRQSSHRETELRLILDFPLPPTFIPTPPTTRTPPPSRPPAENDFLKNIITFWNV
ncbi:guanine nucleotide exchange factor in Golgi transport N-terminal-domain-containing protein [Russula emetica]|nr:guanine nucleotide exchange factor in Golgi transport N-terminal-domain-containing protein [Russula emetica]